MIGNSQRETEIPPDLAEGVLPTGKVFAYRAVLDPLTRPTHKQRGQTSGRYAIYWNAVHQSSGHAWQGRYHSCPLDRVHLWEALRYAELNPVRAGLAIEAKSVDVVQCSRPLRNGSGERNFRFGAMAESLECECLAAVSCGRRDGIQAGGDSSVHHTGRPLGSAEFVQALEGSMKRRLAPQKGGRPPKSCLDARQSELAFEPE
jgi:putative transposase